MNYFCKSRIIYLTRYIFTKRSRLKRITISKSKFYNSDVRMKRNSNAVYSMSAIKKTKKFQYSESVKQ